MEIALVVDSRATANDAPVVVVPDLDVLLVCRNQLYTIDNRRIFLKIEMCCVWCHIRPRTSKLETGDFGDLWCSAECMDKWDRSRKRSGHFGELCAFCECRPRYRNTKGKLFDYCGDECRIAARDFEFGMTAPQKIFHDGRWYENAYFLYEARKFLPAYPAIADEISQCKYDVHCVSLWGQVREYKRLGYVRPDWEEIRTDVLQDVLRLKFGRSHELRSLLKAIEEPYIVAVMPSNNQWGTGSDGRGENELGKALTKLRDTLRDNV